jgi:hypothetical protein
MRVVQCGCGPIGCGVARIALERPNIEVVGAVDIAVNAVKTVVEGAPGLKTMKDIPLVTCDFG